MARRRRRSKSRKSRRNPSARRATHRKGRRVRSRGRRRVRRNPLFKLTPGATVKQLTTTALPVIVGYLGVNVTWWAARKLIETTMPDRWAAMSPATRQAVEAGVSLFVGVPAATYLGSQIQRGKTGLVAAGAIANAGLTIIDAVVQNIPGLPSWVQTDLLGSWPGGSGVYGAGDYLTAAQQAPGVSGFGPLRVGMSDYMTVGGRSTNALPAIAGGGRGAF